MGRTISVGPMYNFSSVYTVQSGKLSLGIFGERLYLTLITLVYSINCAFHSVELQKFFHGFLAQNYIRENVNRGAMGAL